MQKRNSVINDVVVAPNLFIIVEADLNVPISEALVGARGAGSIGRWVIWEKERGFLQGDCRLLMGKFEFFAVRDSAKVRVSARLGSSL